MGQKLVVFLVALLVPGGLIALVAALLVKRWELRRRLHRWSTKRALRSPHVAALAAHS